MKLSARNVIPGTIVSINRGATTAHVKVEVAPGYVITSSITNESVDDLGLALGKAASVVVKSSDVILAVD